MDSNLEDVFSIPALEIEKFGQYPGLESVGTNKPQRSLKHTKLVIAMIQTKIK